MADGGPSTEDLTVSIRDILRHADLTQTTAKKVRRQLEQQFGVELSERKHEIDRLVMEAISEQTQDEDEEEEEDDPSSSEDEEQESEESSDEEVIQDGRPRKRKRAGVESGKAASTTKKPFGQQSSSAKQKSPAAAKPKSSPAAKQKGAAASASPEKPKNYGPIMILSPELEAVIGVKKMAKTLVVQKMWAVIRERNLQDPSDKRYHLNDDQLLKVFNGERRILTFGMMKYLKQHMKEDPEAKELAKQAKQKATKAKNPSSRKSGYAAPMVLSPELAAICGEPRLSRGDVVKKMWEIVRERNLKDPKDGRYHICDDQLMTVFGCRRIYTFKMMKYLAKHMKDGRLCV